MSASQSGSYGTSGQAGIKIIEGGGVANAGEIRFVDDGATGMIYKGGKVGIGTTAPVSKLDLGTDYGDPGTYPNKITLWSGGANNYFGFGISSNDLDYFSQSNHRFYTGYGGTPGTEKFTILSNGNVGIGTTGPVKKLVVSGGIRSSDPSGRGIDINGLSRIIRYYGGPGDEFVIENAAN